MNGRIFFLLFIFVLAGCNPGSGVKVNTSGIFVPLLFSVNDQDLAGKTVDLGEHILTDPAIPLTVKVYNKTEFPYTNLDLALSADGENSPAVAFVPTDDGEIGFPGKGGTCTRTLDAGRTCEIKLLLTPREGRSYVETLKLSFRNYVDVEEHVGKLLLLAGMPASLTFTNDVSQYTFGQLIGVSQTPVVERAETTTYTELLEIVNAGELPAKNVTVGIAENCTSNSDSQTCANYLLGAYTMENNCPVKLMPLEKCHVRINFLPKNQDPTSGPIPEHIKEINYRSTLTMNYIKDPKGGVGALNAYFRSISTNIEARFRVAQTNLVFETPIVAGNRDGRTFRINNQGYREGEIKAIAFRDSGGSLIGTCAAQSGSSYLKCTDASNQELFLKDLPFTLKDRNNCLVFSGTPFYVNVGSGCLFDLTFQPSVEFMTDKLTEFQNLQPEVIYDSRWQGNVKMVTKKLFNLSATSYAAARLEPTKFTFAGTEYAITGTKPGVVDLGRLTLQSPLFNSKKPIIITFKNVGTVPATSLYIEDGKFLLKDDGVGQKINVGGSVVSLGASNPKYYTSVIASDSTCGLVAPGDSCTLTMLFAPIGMTTNADEFANMFDDVGTDGKRFKAFKIFYDSGAKFTDDNLDGDPNYVVDPARAHINAELIRKGMLMQLADDSRNVSGLSPNLGVAGDTSVTHLYLQNIGTGPVPYIRYMNPVITANPNYTIVNTPNPTSLGADYDCSALVDVDYTGLVATNAQPSTRLGHFAELPKDKSCVFTIKYKKPNNLRRANVSACNNNASTATSGTEEGARLVGHELTGIDMWEYCIGNANMIYAVYNMDYFDGDLSNPALTPAETYGKRFSLSQYNLDVNQGPRGKLILQSALPSLTATVYRNPVNLPAVSASGLPAMTIPEKWFYGSFGMFYTLLNDPTITSPFIQGDDSRNFASGLNAYANRSNYDYILYVGSFPQNSPAVTFPFYLKNYGNRSTRVTTFTATPQGGSTAFSAVTPPATIPFTISGQGEYTPTITYQFNTSVPGEHQMEVDFSYETGLRTDELIFNSNTIATNWGTAAREVINQKILVVAHVQEAGTHPFLTLSAQDYEVVQNDGAPPTETLGGSYAVPLSWNEQAPASTLIFDSIKLKSTPTANDVFAKKVLTFVNTTAYPIQDFKPIYKASTATDATKSPPASLKTLTAGTTCTSGMTLAAGQSCKLVIQYQPTASDSSETFLLTSVYRMGVGQYVMQNVGFSLLPKSPGTLISECLGSLNDECSKDTINYKPTAGVSTTVQRFSYFLQYPDTQLNAIPKVISFSQATGSMKKIKFVNKQASKASLLLSYHKYLAANNLRGYTNASPPPTSVVPDASEYYTGTDGESYVPIHLIKYANGTTRIKVDATKGCLFGDDETNAAVLPHQKGFYSATAKSCFVAVTFNANFDYLYRTVSYANGDDMREVASELWYYSYNRSSTDSVWVHVKGTILPDTSTLVGSYANVTSLENRSVSFTTPKMTATTPAVGNIVGLRVFMSTSSSGLNNPYLTTHKYVDIRPYDPMNPQFASFTTDLANGQYFWFRTVAIRYDSRFVDGTPKRFAGLGAGEYLSAQSAITTLKTLVPPLNHYYFHANNILVDKGLTGGVAYLNQTEASQKCTSRAGIILKTPSNVSYPYKLITSLAWDLIMATAGSSNYTNVDRTSHWTSDPTVTVDAACSALPGYVPAQSSQFLNSSSVFYLRNSTNPAAAVNTAVGGIPGSPSYSDYTSYVNGLIQFASSRCMVVLP